MHQVLRIIIIITCLISKLSFGESYILFEERGHLVGDIKTFNIPNQNTKPLEYYAARFNTGLSNLLEANPGIDPWLPAPGYKLIIPQKMILPNTTQDGILINNAEMRLYYYQKEKHTVTVLPVGIGMVNGATPNNWITHIQRKKSAPTWTPTLHERQDYLKEGTRLPAIVPAGPENPMGNYALYLGNQYAIHGTNANFGIGLRVSHGCVRLRNDDIKYLFDNVPTGTRVQFINQPIKISKEKDGSIWIEVHEPLSRSEADFQSDKKIPLPISNELLKMIQAGLVDNKKVDLAISERSGIPLRIDLMTN